MGHDQESYLRSFAIGVLLATLPVVAFVVIDYRLAPPSRGLKGASMDATGFRQAAAGIVDDTPGVMDQPGDPIVHGSVSGYAASRRKIIAIQKELTRVGCYAGEPDGLWSDRTRLAMQSFNSSLHIKLPTGDPNDILLSLVQGYRSNACTRFCDEELRSASLCVDTAIEVQTTIVKSSPVTTHPATNELASVAPEPVTSDARPMANERSIAGSRRTMATAVESAQSGSVDGRMAIGGPQSLSSRDAVAIGPRPQRVQRNAPARSPHATFSDRARHSP